MWKEQYYSFSAAASSRLAYHPDARRLRILFALTHYVTNAFVHILTHIRTYGRTSCVIVSGTHVCVRSCERREKTADRSLVSGGITLSRRRRRWYAIRWRGGGGRQCDALRCFSPKGPSRSVAASFVPSPDVANLYNRLIKMRTRIYYNRRRKKTPSINIYRRRV